MGSLGISVTIAGRTYRLTVENELEEEVIRRASSEINNKVKVYSENYSFKDHQDLLAMVCLELASKKLTDKSMDHNQKAEIINSLKEINSIIQ